MSVSLTARARSVGRSESEKSDSPLFLFDKVGDPDSCRSCGGCYGNTHRSHEQVFYRSIIDKTVRIRSIIPASTVFAVHFATSLQRSVYGISTSYAVMICRIIRGYRANNKRYYRSQTKHYTNNCWYNIFFHTRSPFRKIKSAYKRKAVRTEKRKPCFCYHTKFSALLEMRKREPAFLPKINKNAALLTAQKYKILCGAYIIS